MKLAKQFFWAVGTLILFFSCKKEKSLEKATQSAITQWEFKDSNLIHKGTMDTAYILNVGPISSIGLEGTSTDLKSNFYLEIFGVNITKGTYKSPNVKFAYVAGGTVLYESVPINSDKFVVTITHLDADGITGTFSGEVEDPGGKTKKITAGSFSAKFKTSSAPPPPPNAGTGQLMFWSKKGCTGTTRLTVKVQNLTDSIATFYAAEPACGAPGTAVFNLPAGTYTWKAFCGSKDSVSGTVSVTASQCVKKEVIFPTPGAPPAQFVLATTAGNCSNVKVNGVYEVGTVLGATNTVEVEVNVTLPGAYNISTALKNGITFDGSGSFTTTGLQKVLLTGQGTPTLLGANSISVSAGTSTCAFNVDVIAGSGGGPVAGNTWSFTEGSVSYVGVFDTKALFVAHPLLPVKMLVMVGGIDTALNITIQLPNTASKPIPGTYKTDPSVVSVTNFNNFSVTTDPFTNPTDLYKAKNTPPVSSVIMSVVITSYDAATKIVEGTFSGKAWNKTGAIVNITNGKFKCEVDL